jgi:allantoicase
MDESVMDDDEDEDVDNEADMLWDVPEHHYYDHELVHFDPQGNIPRIAVFGIPGQDQKSNMTDSLMDASLTGSYVAPQGIAVSGKRPLSSPSTPANPRNV